MRGTPVVGSPKGPPPIVLPPEVSANALLITAGERPFLRGGVDYRLPAGSRGSRRLKDCLELRAGPQGSGDDLLRIIPARDRGIHDLVNQRRIVVALVAEMEHDFLGIHTFGDGLLDELRVGLFLCQSRR